MIVGNPMLIQAVAENEMVVAITARMLFQVIWNEGKGRHGVATRDVAAGEVEGG